MSKRCWWYEVTEIWGYEGRDHPLHVGAITIDEYNRPTVNIMNFKTFERVGGWAQKRLGERAGEWIDGPNPDWLSPLAKLALLPADDPERIRVETELGWHKTEVDQ